MSGRPAALHQMIDTMAHGGRIALLGLPAGEITFDWVRVITSMLTIKGIYGREMFETWYAMSVLIEAGLDISPVITHRFPYSRVRRGVRHRGRAGSAARSSSTGRRPEMPEVLARLRAELRRPARRDARGRRVEAGAGAVVAAGHARRATPTAGRS